MALYKQQGSDRYWCRFQFEGRQIRRPTHTSNKRAAAEIEVAIRTDLAKEAAGIIGSRDTPTVEELAPRFLAYVKEHAKTARTLPFYVETVKRLLEYRPLANAHIDAIDQELQAAFVVHRRRGVQRFRTATGALIPSNGVKNATINRALATLRRMCKLAEGKFGLINKAPTVTLLPGEHAREYVLPPEDQERYFAACSPELARLARFILLTSVRPGEAQQLCWSDVHLKGTGAIDRPYLRVPKSIAKGKQKDRFIPLLEEAVVFLDGLPRKGARVVGDRAPLLGSMEHAHKRVRMALGLDREFVLHSLRHTALTRLGQLGISAIDLQHIAGHASIVTTMKYVHAVPEHLARAMDRADAMARVIMMKKQA